ncbi:MAG TPA: type III-A CRISPR-associated RAMP protein Csm5 [bacterium]|nr:type III-A CRISPR-associated RAMP protein Csm5 [bacterium]
MKIKIKVLSPVHIGSGKEISPLEYVLEENKFIRINMDALFQSPEFSKFKDKFLNMAQSERYIKNILPLDLLLSCTLYQIDISKTTEKFNPIEVKEFIKSCGSVYIPGSSLKGSILSGLMEEVLYKKNIKKFTNFENHLAEVLSEITGKYDRGKFAQYLIVRDSNFKKPEESLELSLSKLIGAKTQNKLPILYETLKINTEFETEIKTTDDCKFKEEEILSMADRFYREVYKKEKEYATGKIIILPEPPKDGYLLRLGQGSTAWATSFLILSEKLKIFYKVQKPKTRKLISGAISMGWVSIQII